MFNAASVREIFNLVLQETSTEFTRIASSIVGHAVHLEISKDNQLRLVNLNTFAERSSLSFEEVLRVLITYWRGKHFHKRGLGVSIPVLAGKKSRDILNSYIKTTYPQRENIAMRQDALRTEILGATELAQFDDPFSFTVNYKQHLNDAKKSDLAAERKFARRKWRGNPFCHD